MDFTKETKEKFLTGSFGKVYSERFINLYRDIMNETCASESKATATFGYGAKEDDLCIQVTLRIVTKSEMDKEDNK